MKLHLSPVWHRIEGSYKDFVTTFEDEAQIGPAPMKQKFYDAAIAASDAKTDFSGIEIVFFAIPTGKPVFAGGPHEFNFNYNAYLKTAEGNIFDTATAGNFFLTHPGQPPWVYYVHETGHMIGIPHQADEETNRRDVMYLVNPLGGYDIMSNQGGATRTITTWLRWLAGWLDDERVICVSKERLSEEYYQIYNINELGKRVKSVVIKLSESKAIVIESRRFDPAFDVKTNISKDGVLVYTVDAKKSSAQGSQVLLSPRDITKLVNQQNTWPSAWELDALFFEGDFVIYEGMKIEVIWIGNDSDIVKVTKIN
jgi:M6 family metalloprotease-like protein